MKCRAIVVIGAGLILANCSSATKKADARFDFVYAHGTNREVCDEGKRRKAVYVDAGKYDVLVWNAASAYCLAAELGRGDEPADTSSEAYRRYRAIEERVANEALAASNAAMAEIDAADRRAAAADAARERANDADLARERFADGDDGDGDAYATPEPSPVDDDAAREARQRLLTNDYSIYNGLAAHPSNGH